MSDATSGTADVPLLDLDTAFHRYAIMIDGQRIELLSTEELSIAASHRLGIKGRRIDLLSQSADAGDGEELERLITEVAWEVLVGLDEATFAKLSGAQKMSIVDVFTGLLLRNKLGVAGAMATAAGVPQIGERLSRASSASTAGTPAGGWRTLLRRLFGRT